MAANTIKVKMESTAGTGYFKTTTKNPKNHPEKMQLKKWDPKARQYVLFVEKKVK